MADNKSIFSGLGFNNGGRGNAAKISSVAMFIAVTFFFVVIVFFFVLYIYGFYYLRQRTTARSRTRFIFFNRESPVLSRGLDPAILRSLPVMVYRPSDFQEGLECAVCISEIAEGEEIRLLPKCNHGFHLECIDMWFHSHSTCPLCRCPVIQEVSAAGQSTSLAAEDEAGHDAAGSHTPGNVQSLGNQEQDNNGSLGSESVLVISIPLRTTEGMFTSLMPPLQSSRGSVQDRKSPVEARSPAASKLGSFRRPLSRGKRNGDSCSSSPRIGDIEQGMVGSVPSN